MKRSAALMVAAGAVFLALLMGVLRFYVLPRIADHRAELELRIGELIDERVAIGAVSAGIRGFHPELVLSDFRIVDANGRAGVRFDRVVVGVHLGASLLARKLVPLRVMIYGTRLSVRQRQDGSLAVLGLNLVDHPPFWILAADRIELLDSRIDWQDEQRGAQQVDLGRADLRLANDGLRHQIQLDTRWADDSAGGLLVRADLEGDLFQSRGWSGQIYVESDKLAFNRLRGLLPAASGLADGRYTFRLWSDWTGGAMTRIAGRLEALDPAWAFADGEGRRSVVKFGELETWLRWRDAPSASVLSLQGLRWKSGQGAKSLPARVSLGLERNAEGDVLAWRAKGNRLRFDDFAAVAEVAPAMPADARALWKDLAPRGILHDFSLVYRPRPGSGAQLMFCGELSGVSIRARNAIPGFSRVGGRICGTERSGTLRVSSRMSEFEAPELLPAPVRLDGVELNAVWQRADHALNLSVGEFAVNTPDFGMQGRGSLTWPDDPDESPNLDFGFSVSSIAAEALKHYLPQVAFPAVSRFLDGALIGGRVERSEVQIRGPVSGVRLGERAGTVRARFDLRNIDFRYSPDWPPMRGLNGTLTTEGDSLVFEGDGGSVGRGEISRFKAVVKDPVTAPRLYAEAAVRAGVGDVVDFLRQTPRRRSFEGLLQFGDPSGHAEIGLALAMPLDSASGSLQMNGTLKLSEARFAPRNAEVTVGPLTGDVRFTESGVSGADLSGTLQGDPVTIAATGTDAGIDLSLDGHVRTSMLERFIPSMLWRRMSGDAGYRLKALVPLEPRAGTPVNWSVTTDLRGILVDLPPPLGKSADAVSELTLSGRFESGNPFRVQLSYDRRVKAVLTWTAVAGRWSFHRADIGVGRDFPSDRTHPGIAVFARVPDFDVAAWSRVFSGFPATGQDENQSLSRVVDIEASHLLWSGRDLGGFKLQLAQEKSGWKGHIDGDLAEGKFNWLANAGNFPKLALDLDRLALPRDLGPGGADAGRSSAVDLATLPSLEVRSRKLVWKDADVGALSFDAERQTAGWTLKNGELQGGRHRIRFTGEWTAAAGQGKMRLSGQASADSLGELAAKVGAGAKIVDTRSTVDFRLSWPGAPWGFRRDSLDGEIDVNMGQGMLLDVEPGWGRLIGFLNLNSLWRRINLDFRDLFNKGFAYDRIQGKWRIESGNASTQGFLIDGMSARIVIDGSAQLKAETVNQLVTVIPRTSVALPIAGTLAGGPAVGAAILVAQELVGEHVDSITATRYHVTGPWEAPSFTRVEGNMPMELLGRAWSGLKNLSGPEKPMEKPGK